MLDIRIRRIALIVLTVANVGAGGCVSPPSGDIVRPASEEQRALGSALRDAVNEARALHGLPRTDQDVRLYGPDEFPRTGRLFGHRLQTTYSTRTELYVVADWSPGLDYWVALTKDRSRYFLLGETGTPEGLTAFLEYEGKVPHAGFNERDAVEFMEFLATCASYEQGEMHVVWSFEHLRRLLRLERGNSIPADADESLQEIRAAVEATGVDDIAPFQQEILPGISCKLEFHLVRISSLRLARVAVIYELRGGGPPRVTKVFTERVIGMRSGLEIFNRERGHNGEGEAGDEKHELPNRDDPGSPEGEDARTRDPQ